MSRLRDPGSIGWYTGAAYGGIGMHIWKSVPGWTGFLEICVLSISIGFIQAMWLDLAKRKKSVL